MAVRKAEPADSTVDGQMSANHPISFVAASGATLVAEPASPARAQLTGIDDAETMVWGWSLRLLRAGASLLLGFEIAYFFFDLFLPFSPLTPAAIVLHAGTVGLATFVLALTTSKWFERHWRPVCFANLLTIYALTLALRLLSGETQPLFITLTLTVIGAGALMPWSVRWQAALTVAALSTIALPAAVGVSTGPEAVYRLIGVLTATALGHFIVLMQERQRFELIDRMNRLRASHQELAEALAHSAMVMEERERAERRLREGEEMLHKIFDAAPDGISICRMSDGAMLEVNREFLKAGYTREEVLGASAAQLNRWSRPPLREMMRALRANGIVHNFETELRNKDGRMVPSLISATMVELGGEQCLISMTRDITGLKQTERELLTAREALSAEVRELEASQRRLLDEIVERTLAEKLLASSEATLRKIFETGLDSIIINRWSDGRFVAVNDEFLRVTGYTREEALAATAAQLKIFVNRRRMHEIMERLRINGFARNFEMELRTKDGRPIPHLFSATLVKVTHERCVIAIIHDISPLKQTERELIAAREMLSAQVDALSETQERLRAEIAERELAQHRLQESERTLRKIFETSLDAITIKRVSDGRYIDVNNAFAVFGYRREEALGKTSQELGTWADPKELEAFSERLRLEGQVRNSESLCRTRDGRVIPSLISAVTVEIGGEPCVISFVRDISRLKQTERELIAARETALAASEAKSHFLSVMSHEIRTPMNAILGMAELLRETPLDAEQRRYLDTMSNNGSSLLDLVNDILDLSKVESGRLSLERVNFDLVELAESVMETMGPPAHEKGLELALRIAPALPTALTGDPLRLRQILINLVANAIKFTEHGEVTLSIDAPTGVQAGAAANAPVEADDATSAPAGPPALSQPLRFVIRDTGIGIPADQQQAIFSSFIQADPAISRKYGGSGLGLAIVKRLVELMKGTVTVESRLLEGSIFTVIVALELQPGAAVASPAVSAMAGLSEKRVLVVDQSPASRDILAELLAQAGARVATAADGAGALDELARARAAGQPYDVVVADNRTPARGGAELGPQVLNLARGLRPSLVLMLAANDLHSQLARLRVHGLEESQRCRHLLKPVRRAELWTTVAAACAGAYAERSHHGTDHNGAAAVAAGHAARLGASLQRSTPHLATLLVNRPLRILLAEDSPDNRLLVEAYMKDTPYQLDHAENGEDAVHKFMKVRYDVILMDIQMPVMDGYEATAEIRRLERSDHRRPTPIIALTASAHDEAVRRSFEMGCDAHVTKPVKRSTLLETVRDAVEPVPHSAPSPTETAGNGAGHIAMATPQGPIVVEVDQELSDLIPGFLGRKREDARAILIAAEHREQEALTRLGHKMKGEGGSYGLNAITEIGRELEQAGKDGDFDAARRLGRDLADFLERLRIDYRPAED
jgi:PAS domain S-box-containing protein